MHTPTDDPPRIDLRRYYACCAALGIESPDVAARTRSSYRLLASVLAGERRLTARFAVQLEAALGAAAWRFIIGELDEVRLRREGDGLVLVAPPRRAHFGVRLLGRPRLAGRAA